MAQRLTVKHVEKRIVVDPAGATVVRVDNGRQRIKLVPTGPMGPAGPAGPDTGAAALAAHAADHTAHEIGDIVDLRLIYENGLI